jgi:S1-C subfamily serine protease
MKPGDVVTKVGNKDIGNVAELLTTVAALKPGVATPFKLQRRDENMEVTVTPGKRPKPRQQQQALPER